MVYIYLFFLIVDFCRTHNIQKLMYDLSDLDSGYYSKSGGLGIDFGKIKGEWSALPMWAKVCVALVVILTVMLILSWAGYISLAKYCGTEKLAVSSGFVGRGAFERSDYGSPDVSRTELVRVVPGGDCRDAICAINDSSCNLYKTNEATMMNQRANASDASSGWYGGLDVNTAVDTG